MQATNLQSEYCKEIFKEIFKEILKVDINSENNQCMDARYSCDVWMNYEWEALISFLGEKRKKKNMSEGKKEKKKKKKSCVCPPESWTLALRAFHAVYQRTELT